MSFKDRHPEIQHLVRELHLLRGNNLKFKDGDPQDGLLMFAEAAIVHLLLERFVRAILNDAKDTESLYNLLQRAVSRGLIRLPWEDQQDGIRKIVSVRNAMLHGNYEQAAQNAGCATVVEYFRTQATPEGERMYQVVDYLFKQIDPVTGKPLAPTGEP